MNMLTGEHYLYTFSGQISAVFTQRVRCSMLAKKLAFEACRQRATFCLLLLIIALGAVPGFGQVVNATLFGTLGDASGAVVADATVTVREHSTNSTAQSVSDSSGNYNLPSL